MAEGLGWGDQLFTEQFQQVLVEGLLAFAAAAEVLVELVEAVFEDEVADDGAAAEDLDRGAAGGVAADDEALGDDRLEAAGELLEQELVLAGGEHRDDALDRLGRGGRVNGGEDLVAGVGGAQGDAEGLGVAQLADEDDVGVLAQGLAECLIEAGGV